MGFRSEIPSCLINFKMTMTCSNFLRNCFQVDNQVFVHTGDAIIPTQMQLSTLLTGRFSFFRCVCALYPSIRCSADQERINICKDELLAMLDEDELKVKLSPHIYLLFLFCSAYHIFIISGCSFVCLRKQAGPSWCNECSSGHSANRNCWASRLIRSAKLWGWRGLRTVNGPSFRYLSLLDCRRLISCRRHPPPKGRVWPKDLIGSL